MRPTILVLLTLAALWVVALPSCTLITEVDRSLASGGTSSGGSSSTGGSSSGGSSTGGDGSGALGGLGGGS